MSANAWSSDGELGSLGIKENMTKRWLVETLVKDSDFCLDTVKHYLLGHMVEATPNIVAISVSNSG